MNRIAIAIMIVFSMVIVVNAGGTTLDPTNDATMTSSMQRMMMELNPETQKKFHESIAAIYMAEALAAMGKKNNDQIKADVAKKIGGKTAKEIIKLAETLRTNMGNIGRMGN